MASESFARWRIPREIDGIALLGDFEHGPGRSGLENRHAHAELELHLVTRGRCAFLLDERRIEAGPGTLVWVPPGRQHTVLDPDPDFRRWMLLARKRLVQRVLPADDARVLLGRGGAAASEAPLSRMLAGGPARALAAAFDEAGRSAREHFTLHNTTMAYLLARAFSAFASSDALPVSATFHPAVARAIALLRDPDATHTRDALARRSGLSEWHLSKLFREQVGVSLVDFRNRCRLERFFALYGDGTSVTMSTAALDAGFGSYPQFHRVFRARMGRSPAEHQRRARGG
jgi:AraC-like DNA-binding protein